MDQRIWRMLVGAFAAVAVAYVAIGVAPARVGLVLLACGGAAAACARGPVRNGEPNGQPWLCFAAGLAALGVAEAVQHFLDQPGARWAVPIRAAAVTALVVGMWLIVHEPPGRRRRGFIDPAIVAIGAGAVSYIFIVDPVVRRMDIGTVDRIVAVTGPVLDLVLLSVAVRLLFVTGITNVSARLLLGGVAALIAGDTLNAIGPIEGLLAGGDSGRLLWIVGAGLVAGAAMHPLMSELADAMPETDAITTTRLVLLGLAAVAGPAALIVRSSIDTRFSVPVVVGGAAILFVLILLRMAGLVRALAAIAQNHAQAIGREKRLRRAAHALVAATDRNAIYATAADAAAALVRDRPHAEVRLLVGEDEAMSLVAGRGRRSGGPSTLALSALPRRAVEQLRGADSVVVTLGDEGLDPVSAAAIAATEEHPNCLLTPLFVDGRIAGLLAVALERPAGEARRQAIETVGSQAALAIETAALTEDLHARAGEERFRSLVQNASDVIAVVDPAGIIRFVTRSVTAMLGYEPATLEGVSISRLLHPDDSGSGPSMLVDGHVLDWRLRRVGGGFRHVEVIVADLTADTNVEGIVLTMRDVTERRELESRLAHQAFHDTLTGLANRALFEDRLGQAFARRARNPMGTVAVIFIDLDDFKGVNDTLGHQAGDELLCSVSARLTQCLRPTDTAARLGGDEFAIVLEIDDVDADRAITIVAERVLAALRAPFTLAGQEVFTRGSLGIAATPAGGETVEELLRNADIAMYLAKHTGKGSYRRFERGMHAPVLRQMELKSELQRAIERRELVLHYQPIVNLATARIVGLEALVRWEHPEYGLIFPGEFVSLAEQAGLIGAMGEWILGEACRQFRSWVRAHPDAASMYVSVNLSGQQLHRGDFVGELERVMRATGIDPSQLLLELTESVLVDETERAIERIDALKARGVRIAIDDFGTGFSSLAYLRRLPVDVLKLASPFVQGLSAGQEPLTETILRLASTLGLDVIAEGIQDRAAAEILLRLGCEVGQGFHFSEAVPAAQAEALVAAGAVGADAAALSGG